MSNLMDSIPFNNSTPNQHNLETLIQQIKQNPQAFEEQVRRNNPQAYQMALQIRNSPNRLCVRALTASIRQFPTVAARLSVLSIT